MSLKLYTYPNNPRAAKALIAAQYNGVEIQVPEFKFGVDNKTPEFLKLNPTGMVPTLETENGGIFESNSIARYVARLGKSALFGSNLYESGLVDQWIDYSSATIDPAAAGWIYPFFGYMPYNKKDNEAAKTKFLNYLNVLNNHLSTQTYLVGERVTLADIIVSMSLFWAYKEMMDPATRKPFTHVNRWFVTLVNKTQFKNVLGEVKLAEVAKVYQPPQQQQAPKKEEKKPVAKKEVAEKDEDEEVEEAPKAKNPLDALPKSKLNLEEFKRVYSNKDTRSEALPFFWEHYDPEGYCIFFADYKYNDENTLLIKTNNLVGGFFQRLEKLHKYAFGCVHIIGEPTKHDIVSVWVFRGNDIPAEMTTCDDSELYTWTRADTNNEATRELIGDYFAWDKPINGKEVLSSKCFK